MITRLKAEDVYKRCDPELFTFTTTEEVTEVGGTIGQGRALKALDFGLSIDSDGFNIFALGESGTGKMTTIKTLLKEKAADELTTEDWERVFREAAALGVLQLSLTGGEPLVRKDLAQLIASANKGINPNSLKVGTKLVIPAAPAADRQSSYRRAEH